MLIATKVQNPRVLMYDQNFYLGGGGGGGAGVVDADGGSRKICLKWDGGGH